MKKILLFCLLCFTYSNVNANTYIEKTVSGYKFKVIEYDLTSEIYDIKIVKTDDATSLDNLLKDNNAISWVNWVFFCPTDYTWCNTSKSFTDNERYIAWEKFSNHLTTWDRAVFWWNKEKVPFIYQSGKINMDDEDKIYYWLGNYPLLLNEWKNMLEYYWDVWLIDNKMKVKTTRNFVCSDENKKNIYFWLVYDVTIDELAITLKDFWCFNALNLDAGASTNFIYNNRYLVWPTKRNILDAIVIERKWLNVKEIEKVWLETTKKLVDKIIEKSKNKEILLKKLNKHIDKLNEQKTKFYTKYSTDIMETNIVWELDKVWYKIDLKDLKRLKNIYLINEINNNLKKLQDKLTTF